MKAQASELPDWARADADSAVSDSAEEGEPLDAPTVDTGKAATDAPGKATRHDAHLVHATRGRVRLKVPGAKGNIALLAQMRASFEGLQGIDLVNVKADSGSLVIHYDPAHYPNIAALFARLNDTPSPATLRHAAPVERAPSTELDEKLHAIEEEAEFLAKHSNLARNVVGAIKALDRQIKRSTDNNIDLKILAPVGLAGFTFLEIGAAAATPMWVTLVIFSLNHFVELQAQNADAKDEG
jgi:hypothetical protein